MEKYRSEKTKDEDERKPPRNLSKEEDMSWWYDY